MTLANQNGQSRWKTSCVYSCKNQNPKKWCFITMLTAIFFWRKNCLIQFFIKIKSQIHLTWGATNFRCFFSFSQSVCIVFFVSDLVLFFYLNKNFKFESKKKTHWLHMRYDYLWIWIYLKKKKNYLCERRHEFTG